jgi:hypothetical protein
VVARVDERNERHECRRQERRERLASPSLLLETPRKKRKAGHEERQQLLRMGAHRFAKPRREPAADDRVILENEQMTRAGGHRVEAGPVRPPRVRPFAAGILDHLHAETFQAVEERRDQRGARRMVLDRDRDPDQPSAATSACNC